MRPLIIVSAAFIALSWAMFGTFRNRGGMSVGLKRGLVAVASFWLFGYGCAGMVG